MTAAARTLFFFSTPVLALLASVLAGWNIGRLQRARGAGLAAIVLTICAIALVGYATGGDDDTSNHASRWAVHPSAHTPISVALLADCAAAAAYLAARRRAALVWAGIGLTAVATVATLWSLSQTLH